MTIQKLELTWIDKDQRSQLESRILLEGPRRSYHVKQRVMGRRWGCMGTCRKLRGLEFPAFADDRAS